VTKLSTGTLQTGQPTLTSIDVELINKLFEQLKTIFPAWRQAFKDQREVDLAKKQWVLGFQESGVTDWAMIEHGLKKARQCESDFLPSVGKFIGWCRDYVYSATSAAKPDVAYTQLLDWTMQPKRRAADLPPQLWWCYQQIGAYEWAHMTGKEQRQAFNAAYSTALGMLAVGHVFDAAPEPKSETLLPVLPADQAQVKNYITTLMGALKD
jgi:hypothetical protein